VRLSDSIPGIVDRVIFNQGTYYILNLMSLSEPDDEFEEQVPSRPVKVKGHLYGLLQVRESTPIRLVGKWVRHQKYGREFSFQSWEPCAATPSAIVSFLNTCVEGFSDLRWVQALVHRYGTETFEWLTKRPGAIQAEPFEGISEATVERGLLGWERSLAHRDVSLILQSGGLSGTDIQMVMFKFGMEASKIVAENPFRLLEISGFAYGKVDRLAIHLGVDPEDPRRVQGAVLWALREAAQQGHLYMRRGELGATISNLTQKEAIYPLPLGDDPSKAYNDAVVHLLRQKAAILDLEAGLYLPDLFTYERQSAALLSTLLSDTTVDMDIVPSIESYERSTSLQLSAAQRQAVELLAQHRVLVITGLPGTGKTTVLRVIVRVLENAKKRLALMAPTGIAAKRLSAVTGHAASTIHRALKYDGEAWGYHENNRYVVDAVVLDEASMMDQELFYRLLSSLRPDTRLVLVGDDAQLPSVGPGNVLRELLDCAQVPHVRLTEIFRQSVQGEIVGNSHKINSGKLPDLGVQDKDSEFRFVRLSDEERIVSLIVEMAVKLKARNANFQVLSPKYDGLVGVNNLNERLRDALNPEGPKEEKYGDLRFRQGDRLMVVANDYELGVYNGDVGKLAHIGKDEVVVRIHGVGANAMDTEVVFKNATIREKLRLAYAITVHKSQGSEFDTILMPIVRSQGRMLQRNLLYTAVTRARKRVWLIGEETAVQKAIENNKVIRRNTAFSKSVTACLAAGVRLSNDDSGKQTALTGTGSTDPLRQGDPVVLDRGS
jgi:exodeoxyribonuclease V alpha subunit